jgi:SPP1 gp7 family putative phage head morphogenesis protein
MARLLDRTGKRANWVTARNAEVGYTRRLLAVARQVGGIIDVFAPNGFVRDMATMLRMLDSYSNMITPWAESVANYMVADVARRNENLWKSVGQEISVGIRAELASNTGIAYREMMGEQVALIKSLPTQAGQRVHKLTTEALTTGRRAEDIAKEIKNSTGVTMSRARLIARTEVSRTSFSFLAARAIAAGSPGYYWRTSEDDDVRLTHQKVNGDFITWDAPPKTDKNLAPYHAGCGPNCRCWAEPTFPDL